MQPACEYARWSIHVDRFQVCTQLSFSDRSTKRGHFSTLLFFLGVAPLQRFTTTTAADITCLTLDSATGTISASHPVGGPAAAYFAKLYGESTRIFPFDPKRERCARADFLPLVMPSQPRTRTLHCMYPLPRAPMLGFPSVGHYYVQQRLRCAVTPCFTTRAIVPGE